MRKNFFGVFFLIFAISFSQEEASYWYFGENAGIHFNANGSVSNLTDGRLNTVEGCTTISDNNGDLLFYTDGITVWNKLHQPMSNANGSIGNGLYGDPSSSQSAIVVPKPNDLNIYYVFTVDTAVGNGDPDRGFNYSIVDLSLNGGLGDVVSKNVNLLLDSSEKISAVLKDCESKSIWVITLASSNGLPSNNPNFNTFYAYEVSNTGVNTTPVKSTFTLFVNDARGYLKLSPDGTKLACANSESGLYLYDFDTSTGIVSNQTPININFSPFNKPQSPYGVEFSQNNELLYVSANFNADQSEFNIPSSQYGSLLQYDLTATNISASEIVIDDRQMYRGALQLAPNGKIYRAMSITYDLGSPFLSVINNPNLSGLACNYEHNAVALSRNSTQGLPPFITSFFAEKIDIVRNEFESIYLPLCIGDTYTLIAEEVPGATYTWTKDGVLITENDFDLEVSQPGLYNVLIETNSGDCDTLEGEALVEYFDVPRTNPISDIIICDDNNDGKHIFDFSLQNTEGLGTQDPKVYSIKYYISQLDADLNQNEIILPFENTLNTQRIYTRIGISGNNSCFDTNVSFLIEVFNTPIANLADSIEICDMEITSDLDVTNGQTEIDLHQFDNAVLGNQNASLNSITYHQTIIDAETNNNPLNFSYYNQTPFQENIYARIENNLSTNCFSISEAIEITVNPLPEYTNTSLIQCDEDGLKDNITTFNLLEAENTLNNNSPNRSLKFFNSINEAENNLNEISNTNSFKNTTNPQIIYVKVIDTNTDCFSIAELTLETSTTQIQNYLVPAVCDELNSEDGLNTFNLNDISTEMQSINAISFPISYYETYGDALIEENELTSPYNNTNPYSQILYARAENNNACYGISEVALTINKLPNIVTEDLMYYCLNTFPETIPIDTAIINDTSDNYTYNWSNGESTYEIQINEPNIYNVTVTNLNGCSKNRTIIIEPSNTASFNEIKVTDVSENNTITVFVSGEGEYEFSLLDANMNVIKPYQDSNVFDNVYPGIYTIAVKDIKNDCGIVNNQVSVIGFPKYFTPNNDGIHDTWQVLGVSDMFQPNTKILIFNRFGKLIKELNPLGEGWNGLFNGEKLPTDDYWFSIKLQDGRIFKNHFTLKY
ncbi:gliding motility-associated C-terminal domain-containing protein [Flaviramulus basaltis]|uniref:Gliding motility-associated C-terminal domain-containing protein n=1 Tax=Flaviramulus basaltis TaxID=369401 RepID=A0A1K2INV5_9FLAO|nr:T9SS type B sorting domain-containing protein [Flaviramulus basaltis]SFZ93982.1 gliding motility-associated C-terminal domain-containing protein [Flaviramulus basaltis]